MTMMIVFRHKININHPNNLKLNNIRIQTQLKYSFQYCPVIYEQSYIPIFKFEIFFMLDMHDDEVKKVERWIIRFIKK